MIPNVTDDKGNTMDIHSALLNERIIILHETTQESANAVVAQLLYLAYKDSDKDIYLYLNHGGGQSYAGLGIIDTMNSIKPDVCTVALGFAASMGGVILCAGKKGKRFALPNSTIMLHQARYLSEIKGSIKDVRIVVNEGIRLEAKINGYLAEWTGQPLERIIKDTQRDFYLSPQQAIEYGVIDHIYK
ncbi:MAG: ATP-dependent Clp protease proteolytic subunit [Dehalococcoidia bacterium]|jgi:ATP-dependent Clp protease protease subunit